MRRKVEIKRGLSPIISSVMIKTFLAPLNKPKPLIGLVISALLIGLTIYLVPKKLDERGICWKSLSKPSYEALYDKAMRSYVEYLLTESLKQNKEYDKYDRVIPPLLIAATSRN